MFSNTSIQWRIIDKTNETLNVTSLYLAAIDNPPSFIAGQYLTIQLPNTTPAEGKCYSISSSPHENNLRISIKKIGLFSQAILQYNINDTINTSIPYGFFYPDPTETNDLVFIVGGIGIAPCLSIIKHLTHLGDARKIHLYYSNQTVADIAFKHELDYLKSSNKNLNIYYHITREKTVNNEFRHHRITANEIQRDLDDITKTDFFICGSIDFTKSMWQNLNQANVVQHQIYTEGFF